MLKKLLIGVLSVVVIGAIGASAYNVLADPTTPVEPQALSPVTDPVATAIGQGNDRGWQNINENSGGEGEGNALVENDQRDFSGSSNQPGATIPGEDEAGQQNNGNTWKGNNGSQGYGNASLGNIDGQVYGSAGQGNGNAGRQGQGGQGRGRNRASANVSNTSEAVPDPQNGFQEWESLVGTVNDYVAPNFYLVTDDGKSIPTRLGNLSYVDELELDLHNGERVTVVGYYDPSGDFVVGQITLDGQTFVLRDELGRPLWAGGPGN